MDDGELLQAQAYMGEDDADKELQGCAGKASEECCLPGLCVALSYSDMVSSLVKSGKDIVAQMTPEEAHIWHMATGVSGEAGELLDAVKKHVIYKKPLDRENVIEELGDLEFYMESLRKCVGVERSEVLYRNYRKLAGKGGRYESGYSDQAAQDRRDKTNGAK
jgi:NTP pyrophosphatase (non-canonical NTP hydrolase)